MKKTTFWVVAAVLAMAFVSCDSGGSDPEQVYLTGSDTFTRVDAAGNLAITAIYQYDGEGDYYTGDDVTVAFDASRYDIWTVTVDGVVYLADAWLVSETVFVFHPGEPSESTIEFTDTGSGVTWTLDMGGVPDTNPFDTATFTYNGSGKIAYVGDEFIAQ